MYHKAESIFIPLHPATYTCVCSVLKLYRLKKGYTQGSCAGVESVKPPVRRCIYIC